MSSASQLAPFPRERVQSRRAKLGEIRARAERLFYGGATGVQVAAFLSNALNELVLELVEEALGSLGQAERSVVERHAAVVAVGGSGRGEAAPHSDTDLMFLYRGRAARRFPGLAAQVVRGCWDAGLKLGHSVRTIGESVNMARQDPQIASALLESRRLWGDPGVFEKFKRRFRGRVVRRRKRAFIETCIEARKQERSRHNATVHQLEPDVKCSLGGLRDVHLIRWIGFARYGTNDIDTLRLMGALNKDDARRLIAAHEFLLRVRIDLHFAAGRAQDILSRQEQLRIAGVRGIVPVAGQRPVERFMQDYFRHSTAIADIAQRLVALERPEPLASRFRRFVTTRRLNRIYKLGPETLDVAGRFGPEVCSNLERVLRFCHAAALCSVSISSEAEHNIKQSLGQLREGESASCRRIFLDLLGVTGSPAAILRSMHRTGVLDVVLPEMAHARCLLQFNEYHSYTVDEHTLRTIESLEEFERDEGPLGSAYRSIRHKEVLRLALLLHDVGKGRPGDHSDVGREIAEQVAERFELNPHKRDTLIFLVHKHLRMAHLAFRRNAADPEILVPFAHEVGSPETLQMLYVLTAADLMAVGPGVWTEWKDELLTDLYDRAMLILSGKHYERNEADHLERIKQAVRATIVPLGGGAEEFTGSEWLDQQFDALAPHYLSATPPARIAADLDIVQGLRPATVAVEGAWDEETGTVDYRIIAHRKLSEGCFHKVAGVLTAKRLEILAAQISTSADGTVIDSFRVLDADHCGAVPQSRIDDIRDAIRNVLTGQADVLALFQRHRRFASDTDSQPISGLPTRVVIDNDSYERCTVIDVFAHDRPGLLYTISQKLFEMGLSVLLAKIATHSDQVVDVFYVTDTGEMKITDENRLRSVQNELADTIEQFETHGHREFSA